MKRGVLIVLIIAWTFYSGGTQAQTKKEKLIAGYINSNYEVECLGTGVQGSQFLKVWGYGNSPENAVIEAKRNAVHAVIFKGITVGQGCMKNPLVTNKEAEQNFKKYFDDFFAPGGKYLDFVALTGEGVQDRIRVDRRTYKVGINVSVMSAALRKELESAGIINKLSDGF